MASATIAVKRGETSFLGMLRQMRRRWYCYVGMSGTIALLIVFAYYPAVSAFYHSFTVWDGYRPARWTGLDNYVEVFSSPRLLGSFRNMVLLSAWVVLRAVCFPVAGAALIFRLRSEGWAYFFRLLFVLPIVVPGVVSILVWQQLYRPDDGLLNVVLRWVGLPGLGWLSDPNTALFSLMLMGFPWIDGVGLLIFLAGFLAIPTETLEAAIVDGASNLRRFFSIEFPLLVPQIRLVVILNVIGSLQGFGWQLLVTRGGPLDSTTVPAWEMYRAGMAEGRFGVGSAIGVVLFTIIFTLTLINNAAIRSTVEYEAK